MSQLAGMGPVLLFLMVLMVVHFYKLPSITDALNAVFQNSHSCMSLLIVHFWHKFLGHYCLYFFIWKRDFYSHSLVWLSKLVPYGQFLQMLQCFIQKIDIWTLRKVQQFMSAYFPLFRNYHSQNRLKKNNFPLLIFSFNIFPLFLC